MYICTFAHQENNNERKIFCPWVDRHNCSTPTEVVDSLRGTPLGYVFRQHVVPWICYPLQQLMNQKSIHDQSSLTGPRRILRRGIQLCSSIMVNDLPFKWKQMVCVCLCFVLWFSPRWWFYFAPKVPSILAAIFLKGSLINCLEHFFLLFFCLGIKH
jgi:hypothetical protein